MLHQSIVNNAMLVVDLDGTLLRSDMLMESFWSAIRLDWRCPLVSVLSLAGGRARLKRYLAQTADTDYALLPYNDDVIAYVEAWRAAGGRTALVTASDQSIADGVAQHLGLFDAAHGSDGRVNLKGQDKAAFLNTRFGDTGYAYIGNAVSDLAVWRHAQLAITVDANPALRRQVEQLECRVEHLHSARPSLRPFAMALRPHQWLKNFLVFVPMLAAHKLEVPVFLCALLAFLAFNLVASSVYVLNDLLDLASDRAHPRKRSRPFASGQISLGYGTLMAPLLLFGGGVVAACLGAKFAAAMLGYYLVTMAYSFDLRRRLIVDICVLALLYTARIVAGGAATDIALSVWLLAFSFFFFISLAAVKRQAELVDLNARGGLMTKGRGYHVDDLPLISMMAVVSGYISVLVLALYLNSSSVTQLYHYPQALWGICVVLLYWISRMVLVTHRGQMHDDPLIYAVKDGPSRICAVAILGLAIAGTLL